MEKRTFFDNSDVSLTIVRRRSTELLVDLLAAYGQASVTWGRSFLWNDCFSSDTAMRSATSRLKRQGVIVMRETETNSRLMHLNPSSYPSKPSLKPEAFWDQKWRGKWSILTYDIPESEKVFRNSLRRFLKRLRMGCLQKSVWISPHDIRPDYDDLMKTLNVENVSFLFDAQQVLGRDDVDIVSTAWDLQELENLQAWYIRTCRQNIDRITQESLPREVLAQMAREELEAYLSVMDEDPLLPRELLPRSYEGFKAFKIHRQFVGLLRKKLVFLI